MQRKNFIRRQEDFVCEHCGFEVKGTGYTNHCANCLWSKHVDNVPGDRANPCGGMMEPIEALVSGDEHKIVHHCTKCGITKVVKRSPDDNVEAILAILKS